MGASDLMVTIVQRRLPCALEPALALGHRDGTALAQRLASVFETWLTRSFWQCLDTSELLLRAHRAEVDEQALRDWVALRDSTDAASWLHRWLGDNVCESKLQQAPELAPLDLIGRYKSLLDALQQRLQRLAPEPGRPARGWHRVPDGDAAAADALALSASLDAAAVLCRDDGGTPRPVQLLQRAGVAAQEVPRDDRHSLFAAERELLRTALAGAGLAAPLRRLPALAVLHVSVDEAAGVADDDLAAQPDRWDGAQAWWYWS